ncbi:MAG: mobile mystery protein B [Planctomycetota bacterium]
MTTWETIPGETPIDPSGLKHKGSVTNRKELAVVEAKNINKAFLKYLAARPSRRSAPFDYDWLLRLHDEMFGEVWEWAGVVRSEDLNLGVHHYQIRERLVALLGDLHSWSGFGTSIEEQAVLLHHKAVQIHPFQNGNGRWARLLSNLWLKLHGEPIVAWPDEVLGESSPVRDEYLDAIKAADRGDYEGLTELHRRFQEVGE